MAGYPSDAPLPQFQVSSVRGFAFEAGVQDIDVAFSAKVLNYQEVMNWVSTHSTYWDRLIFRLSHGEIISFDANGIIRMEISDIHFRGESFGKWNRLEFIEMINPAFVFATPIYFCDVYIPFPDEMTPNVWTDLQLKQAKATTLSSGSTMIALLALIFLLFLALALFGGRGKRRRGRR